MNSRQRRGLVLVLTAGVLAVLTFILVGSYVASVNAEVGDRITVYRLTKDVAAFTELTAADADPISVPRKWIGPTDFTDDSFVGRQTGVAVKAGSFISEAHLIPSRGLQNGEREIAINVDAEAGVAGRIDPGDYVNVNVTFEQENPKLQVAEVFIRRARIVSIGVRHSGEDRSGESHDVVPVTFALTEANSLKLLYAESFAKSIRLSKVAPADTAEPPASRPYTNADAKASLAGGEMRFSVVVISDNPANAHRLRTLLDEAEELELADLITDSAAALDAVSRRDCQILLVDESVTPTSALDVVAEVSARVPYVATLLLSRAPNPQQLEAVVDCGGRGVVGLDEPFEEIRRRLVSAGQWSLKIRGIKAELGGLAGMRSFVLTMLGAKGGVGTTTLALHTARMAQRHASRVCLLDLDITSSDLASFTAITVRRDLADLAAIGDAMSVQAVQEVVFADAGGLNLICAPSRPERAEEVSAAMIRGLIITLRQMYDVVIIDAGGAMNDIAATALELSDEAAVILNPDMLAVRGARRILQACERLDVRDPAQIGVLVNRVGSRRQLQPSALRRMIPARFLDAMVPADFPALEDSINRADPARVRDANWLRAVNAFWAEIAGDFFTQTASRAREPQRSHRRRGRSGRDAVGLRGDQGVVSVEFMALLPMAFLVIMGCFQLICYGAAQHQATRSAGAAAHALARGDRDVSAAADREAAGSFAGKIHVTDTSTGADSVRVRVSVDVPTVVPAGWVPLPPATAEAGAVREEGR